MHGRNQSERNSTFVFRDQHHEQHHKLCKDAEPDLAAKSGNSLQQSEDDAHFVPEHAFCCGRVA